MPPKVKPVPVVPTLIVVLEAFAPVEPNVLVTAVARLTFKVPRTLTVAPSRLLVTPPEKLPKKLLTVPADPWPNTFCVVPATVRSPKLFEVAFVPMEFDAAALSPNEFVVPAPVAIVELPVEFSVVNEPAPAVIPIAVLL